MKQIRVRRHNRLLWHYHQQTRRRLCILSHSHVTGYLNLRQPVRRLRLCRLMRSQYHLVWLRRHHPTGSHRHLTCRLRHLVRRLHLCRLTCSQGHLVRGRSLPMRHQRHHPTGSHHPFACPLHRPVRRLHHCRLMRSQSRSTRLLLNRMERRTLHHS